jgi:hypothetical protein
VLLFVTMSADAGLWLQLDGRELVSNGVVQELQLDCFRKKVIPLRWRVEKAGVSSFVSRSFNSNIIVGFARGRGGWQDRKR